MKVNSKRLICLFVAGTVSLNACSKVGKVSYQSRQAEVAIEQLAVGNPDTSMAKLLEKQLHVAIDDNTGEFLDQASVLAYIKYYQEKEKPNDYLDKVTTLAVELETIALNTMKSRLEDKLNLSDLMTINQEANLYYIEDGQNNSHYKLDKSLEETLGHLEKLRLFKDDQQDYKTVLSKDLLTQEQFISTSEQLTDAILFTAACDYQLETNVFDRKMVKTKVFK